MELSPRYISTELVNLLFQHSLWCCIEILGALHFKNVILLPGCDGADNRQVRQQPEQQRQGHPAAGRVPGAPGGQAGPGRRAPPRLQVQVRK